MDSVQPTITGVTFSGLDANKSKPTGDVRFFRSILSRQQALKGMKLTLSRIKGTYRQANKEIPMESVEAEVIAPVFEAPQIVEEVSVVEMPKSEEATPDLTMPQIVGEEVQVVEVRKMVEEPPMTLSSPKLVLNNLSQQRGVKAPREMAKDFVNAQSVIDSSLTYTIPNEINIGEIGVPQLEMVPHFEDSYLPVGPEAPAIGLTVTDAEQVEEEKPTEVSAEETTVAEETTSPEVTEEKAVEVPVEEAKKADSNETFSPIGPVPEDDLEEVLETLEDKKDEDIKMLKENEIMKAELERLRRTNSELESGLKSSEDKLINLADRAKQLQAQKAQLEEDNSRTVSALEIQLSSKEKDIIALQQVAKRVDEVEKVAKEYEHKYHLLRGKVFEFVKKSSPNTQSEYAPEEDNTYRKAA